MYAHFKAKLHVLEEREGQLERNDGIRRAQATILRVYNSRFVAAIVMIRPSQDRTRPRCCSHLIWAGKGLASIGDNVWCPDYRVISSSSSRYQRWFLSLFCFLLPVYGRRGFGRLLIFHCFFLLSVSGPPSNDDKRPVVERYEFPAFQTPKLSHPDKNLFAQALKKSRGWNLLRLILGRMVGRTICGQIAAISNVYSITLEWGLLVDGLFWLCLKPFERW